jgi:hypothetical protein
LRGKQQILVANERLMVKIAQDSKRTTYTLSRVFKEGALGPTRNRKTAQNFFENRKTAIKNAQNRKPPNKMIKRANSQTLIRQA